jgi:uncharacterized protein YggT (Ycf19 family)
MTHRDYDQDPEVVGERDVIEREPVRHETVERVEREPATVVERPVERPVVERAPAVVERPPSGGELLRRVVTLAFGILQGLLILRIILLLLIANTDNAIVAFVLAATDPFVEPFRGMFELDRVADRTGVVVDVAAIVALVGWTLVEVLVLAVLSLGSRRRDVVV